MHPLEKLKLKRRNKIIVDDVEQLIAGGTANRYDYFAKQCGDIFKN